MSAPRLRQGLRLAWARHPLADSPRFARTGIGIVLFLLVVMPVLRYRALHSSFYDLGQYVTNYSGIAFDGLWSTAANTHLHLPMLVFAPIFRLAPSPVTLLLLQSASLIAGLFIYVRLWSLLGAGPTWIGAALYGLALPVWFSALADYHFEHLLFPLYGLYAIALLREPRSSPPVLMALAFAICGIKEIYALTAAMLGLLTATLPGRRRTGIAIFAMSAVYFVAATSFVIPAFTDGRPIGDLWGGAFGYLGATPGQMLMTLITRPWVVLEAGNIPRKALFVTALALPFVYVVRGPWAWLLPAAPPAGIVLLSRSEAHIYLGHQYTVAVAIALMVAAAVTLPSMAEPVRSRWSMLSLAATAIVLVLFGPAPVSRLFFSSGAWAFNSRAYLPAARDNRIRALIDEHVPTARSVVVAMQSSLHTARLSHRTHAIAFPQGIDTPINVMRRAAILTHGSDTRRAPDGRSYAELAARGLVMADYVVLDRRRPWMIADRFCAWNSTEICADPPLRALYLANSERLARHFERLAEHDGFEIWRRK